MCATGYITRSDDYSPCSSCAVGYGSDAYDDKCQRCSSIDWTSYDEWSGGPSCACPLGQVYYTKTLKCGEGGGVFGTRLLVLACLPACLPARGCLWLLLSSHPGTSGLCECL